MRFHVFLIGLLMLCCNSFLAQQVFTLEIVSVDNPVLLKKISYKKSHPGALDVEKEMNKVLVTCYNSGYLAATYDSTINEAGAKKAYLTFGNQYKWAHLKNGNIDEGVLSEIGFREKLYANKPIHFKKIVKLQEKLITYFENNGFPFAMVKLDSIHLSDKEISASLYLTKNDEIIIDSVLLKGTAKISPIYIHNYLGIKPGSLYDESKLKKVNTRISELSFVKSSQPAIVKFTDKSNKLILFLEKKKSSQFDGIVGILPDNKTGKVLFTGDVRLRLENALGRGELIDLNWRRLKSETQDLKLGAVYPFVFKSPFGIDYNLKLYKRDTTFLDVDHNVGLQYLFVGGNYFRIFYNNRTSSILSTKGLENLTTLPDYADIKKNMYGLGVKYEKLDYRLNPRKGFSIIMNASVGTKNIKKNPKLDSIVYVGLLLKSTQYNAHFDGSLFIPVFARSVFKIGMKSAFINGGSIFQNELFRIGGLKSIRGFNEETIFASTYSILTLEYRFILEQNSYLYLFGDGAWYESNTVNNYEQDTPYGFGAGISFETKAGIFSINYALGSQFNNPIQLRDGKIHFGIVNYF